MLSQTNDESTHIGNTFCTCMTFPIIYNHESVPIIMDSLDKSYSSLHAQNKAQKKPGIASPDHRSCVYLAAVEGEG